MGNGGLNGHPTGMYILHERQLSVHPVTLFKHSEQLAHSECRAMLVILRSADLHGQCDQLPQQAAPKATDKGMYLDGKGFLTCPGQAAISWQVTACLAVRTVISVVAGQWIATPMSPWYSCLAL